MSEIWLPGSQDITQFDPAKTQVKLAELDGDIVKWRKLKEWPLLAQAVDAKIKEQKEFVANWNRKVVPPNLANTESCAPGHTISLSEAVAAWGIGHPTVSRWRTTFSDAELEDKYRKRLINGPHRVAFAQVGDRDHRLSEMDLPEGRYPILLIDPPWRYENPPMGGGNRSIENHYPTMSLEEICALPVGECAAEDAILYLWATAPKLAECIKVIDAWGFDYRTNLVWIKDKMGMGYHARSQHELLLVAKRGEIPPPPPEQRPSSVISAERGRHSEKPAIVYEWIEQWYPGLPKLELFARSPRDGWTSWGNQLAEAPP